MKVIPFFLFFREVTRIYDSQKDIKPFACICHLGYRHRYFVLVISSVAERSVDPARILCVLYCEIQEHCCSSGFFASFIVRFRSTVDPVRGCIQCS